MGVDVLDGDLGPGNQVVFARRELDETDVGVGESEEIDADLPVEVWTAPEGDTDSVERGEVGTLRGPAEVELSPFGVSDRCLVVGTLDSLEVAVSSAPVEGSGLVGKGHELISAKSVSQERSDVVPLGVRLFLPAGWELALANGEVGVLFDIAKSVDV
jgi:hypothetical protein